MWVFARTATNTLLVNNCSLMYKVLVGGSVNKLIFHPIYHQSHGAPSYCIKSFALLMRESVPENTKILIIHIPLFLSIAKQLVFITLYQQKGT